MAIRFMNLKSPSREPTEEYTKRHYYQISKLKTENFEISKWKETHYTQETPQP